MTVNVAVISGNLTRDCDERLTQSGMTVVNFTVAVNERVKNSKTGEYEDCPNYIRCVFFGKYAERKAPMLKKGAKVTVKGKLKYSAWEKDGQKASKIEIVVDDIDISAKREPAPAEQVSVTV